MPNGVEDPMPNKCKARLGVPGAWPCIRAPGHTGAHIEEGGQACYTEWDGNTKRYDANPVNRDTWSAVPAEEYLRVCRERDEALKKAATNDP